MAGSVNKAIIVGALGRDPEVKTFSNGGKIVNLRVATSESWKDKQSGERRERTEWHSVTISNEGLAKVAEQYLRKGSKVFIEGQLQTRKWQDQSGTDHYSTEIVVGAYTGQLVMLNRVDGDGEGGGRGRGGDDDRGNSRSSGAGGGGRPNGGGGGAGTGAGMIDDEIPFAPEVR